MCPRCQRANIPSSGPAHDHGLCPKCDRIVNGGLSVEEKKALEATKKAKQMHVPVGILSPPS